MQKFRSVVTWLILAVLFSACVPSTRPSLKIGLVAPFVGQYREIGEEIIPAVRLAIREANAAGGVGGYSVELMAYDDEGDLTLAAEQARKLATDPQVVGGMGDWLDGTTLAAAPVYAAAQIPFLATTPSANLDPTAFRLWYTEQAYSSALASAKVCPLPCEPFDNLEWLNTQTNSQAPVVVPALWGLNLLPRFAPDASKRINVFVPALLPDDSADPAFAERYEAISSGVQPRFLAVLAYDATKVMLAAISKDLAAHGGPSRAGVAGALAETDYAGLSGHFAFDSHRNWRDATGWVYQWQAGVLVKP